MPSFAELFSASGGKPTLYKGRVICLADRLELEDGQSVRVKFERANGEWRQGVRLSTRGSFEVDERLIKKAVLLWHDTAPSEVLLKVHTRNGECWIKNVWDRGDGVVDSGHNGAAMIIEERTGTRRYFCNDGDPDEDFDDLVFTVEIV